MAARIGDMSDILRHPIGTFVVAFTIVLIVIAPSDLSRTVNIKKKRDWKVLKSENQSSFFVSVFFYVKTEFTSRCY